MQLFECAADICEIFPQARYGYGGSGKIVTSEKGFGFDGGMMGVVGSKQRIGEVWVWLPKGIIKLTISHQQLGVLKDYYFPERIDAATTYEMVLTSGRVVTIVEETAGVQFFVLRYTPTDIDVDVYIDDVYTKKGENGVVEHKLKSLRYKQVDGVVEIADQKKEIEISLVSSCGTINFSSTPESGAQIYIDNEYAGTTPFMSKDLEEGEYKIDVKLTDYLPHSQTVNVLSAGKQVNVSIPLRPNFATVNIIANSDCEVFVNDVSKGLGGVALNYTNDSDHADHKNSSFKGDYYTWYEAKKMSTLKEE